MMANVFGGNEIVDGLISEEKNHVLKLFELKDNL